MIRAIATLLVAALLGACAEGTSIYHNRPLSAAGDRILTIDAKQRNVLMTRDRDGAWRMCAEAAPDVFSALSASASLDADVTSRSGRVAIAIAEAAATVERTQTVNLLRESMYRTCERYLDGGIGHAELVVQAARDQRAMVKILAIEQLTRAARGGATIIAPGTTSASSSSADAAASLVDNLGKERTVAKGAFDSASSAYASALAKGKCDTVAAPPPDDAGEPKLSEWTACKAAALTRDARQKDYDDANGRFDKALAAAGQLGSQSAATTGAATSQAGGGAGAPGGAALEAVASAVRDIANAPDIDEPMMFCISFLQPSDSGRDRTATGDAASSDRDIRDLCRDILRTRAAQDLEIRRTLTDYAGNRLTFTDAGGSKLAHDPARVTLLGYVTNPASRSERQRRVGLLQQVAADMGLPHGGEDVMAIVNSAPSIADELLRRLRSAETGKAGLHDLGTRQ